MDNLTIASVLVLFGSVACAKWEAPEAAAKLIRDSTNWQTGGIKFEQLQFGSKLTITDAAKVEGVPAKAPNRGYLEFTGMTEANQVSTVRFEFVGATPGYMAATKNTGNKGAMAFPAGMGGYGFDTEFNSKFRALLFK